MSQRVRRPEDQSARNHEQRGLCLDVVFRKLFQTIARRNDYASETTFRRALERIIDLYAG